MAKFILGTTSRARLAGVHPDLVRVVERALEISPVDFKVVEGVRTPARQKELYAQGRTKPGSVVTWTLNSNHFVKSTGFGHAVDLLPAPYDWKTTGPNGNPFDLLYKAMFTAAAELAVPIRWGADWDRDGKPRERGETDSPHFELWGREVTVLQRAILRWLAIAAVALVTIAVVSALWTSVWSWFPWSTESQLKRSRADQAVAESNAAARSLESRGNAAQVARVETAGRLTVQVQSVTAEAVTQARSAPDAEQPLSTERADRLRHADGELCRLAPQSCGAAPAGDPEGR